MPRLLSGDRRHLSGDRPPAAVGGFSLPGGARWGREAFAVDKTARRAEVLGIPGPKRGAGPCVLPDHEHPAHLYHGGDHWKYWCAPCDRGFSLAEVRAIVAYADVPYGYERDEGSDPAWERVRPPGRVEVSRWAELLDYEAGLLVPRHVELAIPDDLSESARAAAREIRLLLGLREDRWEEQGFTFSRRMCRARCKFSDARARAALAELRVRRVIEKVGTTRGRAALYRLGAGNRDGSDASVGVQSSGASGRNADVPCGPRHPAWLDSPTLTEAERAGLLAMHQLVLAGEAEWVEEDYPEEGTEVWDFAGGRP